MASGNVLATPALAPLPPKEKITTGKAQYLIIAHPDFIDEDNANDPLDQFVAAKKAQGFKNVKVVDVEDIYAEFGHYIVDAQAIKDYITYAAQKMQTQMVLLIGGDTYDYHDYLGFGAVSFIPSLYAQTDSIVRYAPVDAKYVDLNNDNIPDLPIGRLPVRTSQELAVSLAKLQTYAQHPHGRTALFAADQFDDAQGYSFSADSDAMLGLLPPSWTPHTAYIDDVGVEAARASILATLNSGVALPNFTGHSGPLDWTFSGLFSSADAGALTNAAAPTVVTQWGCWNTYYVDPYEDTLGHLFMLNPNGGAAAVLGASTLTSASAERELALEVYSRLFAPGKTLGEAIQEAKHAYAQTAPKQLDVLLGWTLLGDPALVIQP